MNWIFLVLTNALCSSLVVVMQKRVFRKENQNAVLALISTQFLSGLFLGIFALIVSAGEPLRIQVDFLFLAMTVLYSVALVFRFRSLQIVDPSKFVIVMSFRSVVGIFASGLLLNEGLSHNAIGGLALILLGIIITSIREKTLHFHRGDLLALVCAFSYGIVNTIDKINLRHSDVLIYTSLSYVIPALFILMVYARKIRGTKLFISSPSRMLKISLISLITAVGATAYFTALSVAPNINQVVALSLLSIVITVILSTLVFKTKSHLLQKTIGAILSIIGAYNVTHK